MSFRRKNSDPGNEAVPFEAPVIPAVDIDPVGLEASPDHPDGSPSDPGPPPDLDELTVIEHITALESQLQSLAELVQERLRPDTQKDALFSKLYRDLDEMKREQAGDRLRPVLLDLILLLDRVERSQVPSSGTVMASIGEELLDILDRHGVSRISGLDTGTLDPQLQHVISVEAAAPGSALPEYRVVREGYQFRDRVLRPQQVASLVPVAAP